MTAIGRAFFQGDNFDKALALYHQADTASMTEHDLSRYALAAFFKQHYPLALEIATYGLTRKPGDINFTRLAFFCNTELKDYDDAQRHARALFSNSATTPLFYYDYEYLVRLINSKATLDELDRTYLKTSYQYLINYYLSQKDDQTTAKRYAQKLLVLDPTNALAKQVLQP